METPPHPTHRRTRPCRCSSGGGGEFSMINDNVDVLAEILSHLDGRSLAAAARVCRLWRALSRSDAVWERLCERHVGAGAKEERAVVVALGGYRRLYRVSVGPVMERMRRRVMGQGRGAMRWGRDEAQLSLSLFSVDCYERLGLGISLGLEGKRSSLMFLCKAR